MLDPLYGVDTFIRIGAGEASHNTERISVLLGLFPLYYVKAGAITELETIMFITTTQGRFIHRERAYSRSVHEANFFSSAKELQLKKRRTPSSSV